MLAPTAAARHGTDNEHVDERQDGATKEDGPSAETHQAEQAEREQSCQYDPAVILKCRHAAKSEAGVLWLRCLWR